MNATIKIAVAECWNLQDMADSECSNESELVEKRSYSCNSTDASTNIELPFEIPQFVKILEDQCAYFGRNLQFKCIVKGYPLPNVRWYLDSIEITTETRFVQYFY